MHASRLACLSVAVVEKLSIYLSREVDVLWKGPGLGAENPIAFRSAMEWKNGCLAVNDLVLEQKPVQVEPDRAVRDAFMCAVALDFLHRFGLFRNVPIGVGSVR